MTALYTGEVPLQAIKNDFSAKVDNKIGVLESMENEEVEQVL
jgi:hypothetical protein